MADQSKSSEGNQPQNEDMLPVDPPPIATRLLATMLILIFVVAFIVSVFVPIPETVRTSFALVSSNGSDPVESRIFGVLDEITINEGQEVEEGELLFKVRSDEIRNWRVQLETAREDHQALEDRIPKAEESFNKQQEILQGMLSNAAQELEYNQRHLENRKNLLQRMTELASDGIISEVELENYQLSEEWSEKNVQVARKTREQTALEIQRLETDRARARTLEQAELRKLEDRIESLRDQLSDCDDVHLSVFAPSDAIVLHVPNRRAGSVVNAGEVLCQLADIDGDVVARLYLEDDSLPKLESGLSVRFFFDAFPYQRYGTVTGTIEWISPSTVETENEPRFLARASMDASSVSVDGKTRTLKPGMIGEARIHVGSRTLLEFAFEPIKQLRENMKQ